MLREGRQIYVAAGHAPTAGHTLAHAAKRLPVVLFCPLIALRDFNRRHRNGANDLARFMRICRVTRIVQPHLDASA